MGARATSRLIRSATLAEAGAGQCHRTCYAAVALLIRVGGKRTLANMDEFDLVVTVAMGSIFATTTLTKDVTLAQGLSRIAVRAFVAGQPNTPDNLIRFIQHPQQARRSTPMPEVGVSDADARNMAAYLYTLR